MVIYRRMFTYKKQVFFPRANWITIGNRGTWFLQQSALAPLPCSLGVALPIIQLFWHLAMRCPLLVADFPLQMVMVNSCIFKAFQYCTSFKFPLSNPKAAYTLNMQKKSWTPESDNMYIYIYIYMHVYVFMYICLLINYNISYATYTH